MSMPAVHLAVVRPWPLPLDRHCDPAAAYAERFWTPILGPSCMALQRSVLRQHRDMASGIAWDHGDQAARIGVGGPMLNRTVERLVTFNMVVLDHWDDGATLIVFDRWPVLTPGLLRSIERRSPGLRRQHEPYDGPREKGDAGERRVPAPAGG